MVIFGPLWQGRLAEQCGDKCRFILKSTSAINLNSLRGLLSFEKRLSATGGPIAISIEGRRKTCTRRCCLRRDGRPAGVFGRVSGLVLVTGVAPAVALMLGYAAGAPVPSPAAAVSAFCRAR